VEIQEDSQKVEVNQQVNEEPQQSAHEKLSQTTDTLTEKKPVDNVADEELEAILSQQTARIKVVGSGGGGNNTINRISEVGIVGAETVAVNTDAQDLLYTKADKKILIGKDVSKGLGAGSNPQIGEESARESEHDLKQALQGSDMV
jgi:cell division protein FtsZ